MSTDAPAARPTRPQRKDRDVRRLVLQGVAGGIAGCVAKTVVAPLDRVKILFQASNPDFQKYAGSWSGALEAGKRIFRETGVRGLLQGHSATLFRVFPYAGIKFLAYDQVHELLMPTAAHETNVRRFAAGAISGSISVFLTYPLEVIRVRMAFQTEHAQKTGALSRPSFLSAASLIYNEGAHPPPPAVASASSAPLTTRTAQSLFHTFPILKFYRGFTVSLIGMIPYAGTSFLAWGYLRSVLLPPPPPGSGRRPSTPMADLAIGAAAGLVAQTVSYPFEVVRRRMQVGGLTRPDRWLRWGETVRAIYARGGLQAFYVGLSIGWVKIVPMNAVSFAVWQGLKRLLDL